MASIWAALPGDLLGRLVLLGCRIEAETRSVEMPLVGIVLLVEDPRTDRYLASMPVRPTAQTIGRYVFARRRLPDHLVRHEAEHVAQWARWGPLFLPAYLAASFAGWVRGGGAYQGNHFEIAARGREATPRRAAVAASSPKDRVAE